MINRLSVVHYSGYDLNKLNDQGDWELVCWGDPKAGIMGRIPTTISTALLCNPVTIIWSTGATKLVDGTRESEHAYDTAIQRYHRLREDFPSQFEEILPESSWEFEDWLSRASVFDRDSLNTVSSMEAAVPILDWVFAGRPGSVYIVTSANHAPRALRDALAIWQHGYVLDRIPDFVRPGEWRMKRKPAQALANRQLVTIYAVAAGTSYGGRDPTDTYVEDIRIY
jgi:hypothetical protein